MDNTTNTDKMYYYDFYSSCVSLVRNAKYNASFEPNSTYSTFKGKLLHFQARARGSPLSWISEDLQMTHSCTGSLTQ